jgi:hypothetical protein
MANENGYRPSQFSQSLRVHNSNRNAIANKLFEFQGFSDIVFNPDKSLNYQARAAALFVALRQKEEVEKVLNDKNYYISLITNQISQTSYSLEKQIDTSEKREQKQELYSLHNSEGLDNQNSVEVVQSATSSQATDSHSLLPDYNVFNNFFCLTLIIFFV